MISVAIKKSITNESEDAKILRDQMLCSVIDDYKAESVKTTSNGKPYLENCDIGFSVSHSGGALLVAVNAGKKVPDSLFYFEGGKEYNIGADIEALGKRNEESLLRICDKRFSDAEKQAVYTSKDTELAFLDIWTKKEAYLKLIGIGIKGIADADTAALEKDYIFYTEKVSLEGKEYVFSVCVKR